MADEKKNIFEQMELEGDIQEHQEPISNEDKEALFDNGEFDFNKLSNIPVGQNKKYIRSDLNGKEVKIVRAQVFPADEDTEPITALNNKDVKYFKCMFLLTYDTKNADNINDREYLSGAIQFLQKDGTKSLPSFWNKGASNQVAELWEKVADFKKVQPEDLSPREFMAFLNSGIKVVLSLRDIKYNKEVHKKNLVEKIIG